MGQYHKVVNLDKNFVYSAKSIANGVKSMEQGYSYTSCLALTSLLSEGWNGERVFLIGDYAEANDVNGVEDATELYNAKMRNVGWLARTIVEKHSNIVFEKSEYKIRNLDHTCRTISYYVSNYGDGIKTIGLDDTTEMRIVNYDSKEMLSVGPNGEGGSLHNIAEKGWDNGIMTILFVLLTASSRGGARGGGDPDHELNGTWAGDRIGIIPATETDGYTDISDKFTGFDEY